MAEPTVYIDKLGEQEIRTSDGLIREVVTRRDVTDWWDANDDDDGDGSGAPVPFGEAVKRLYYAENVPQPGSELKDKGGVSVMENRPLYLIDRVFRLTDTNKAIVELRYEYLGSRHDGWTEVDGSLYQIQTHFDKLKQPITLSIRDVNGNLTMPQGVEASVLDPRKRAVKVFPEWLNLDAVPLPFYMDYFLGKVNEHDYLGKESGEWLVTNVKAMLKVPASAATSGLSLVQISVEIEHNRLGWNQYVFWRDPLTERIGVNLVEDESFKRVDWHESLDFEVAFDPLP